MISISMLLCVCVCPFYITIFINTCTQIIILHICNCNILKLYDDQWIQYDV